MFRTDRPFQCCFCEQTIGRDDEARAVFLTATSLVRERRGEKNAPSQSFYAHGACLTSNWNFSQPWELETILDDD